MKAYYVLVNVKRNTQGKVEYYELKNNSTGEWLI